MLKLVLIGVVVLLVAFAGRAWWNNRHDAAHSIKQVVTTKFYSTKEECEKDTKAICSQPICDSTQTQSITDKICGNSQYHKGVWVPSGY
jgi:hypothetical protein